MYSKLRETYADKTDKVCIFDIDNTLTHGVNAKCRRDNTFYNNPSPYFPGKGSGTTKDVRDVINKCYQNGYGIAIATAETGSNALNQQQYNFLKHVNPKVFTDEFLKSDRYQSLCSIIDKPDCMTDYKYSDKTTMYQNIMNHYGIKPEDWNKSIVFDDSAANLSTASKMGFKVCQASPECGGIYCDRGCGVGNYCLGVINNSQ